MGTVLVIGGGAAGMMAAYAAAKRGQTVRLYEKNEKLGKKIFITGKGRCNLTNGCEVEDLFANVVTNGKFLYSAFYGLTNRDVMELFEEWGCRLKVERGNRVFPVSDKSSDVIAAIAGAIRKAGLAVTECLPALVPFEVLEDDPKELQGLALKNIEATVYNGKKVLYREFGEMLFTHFGVSGPVLLSASSYAAKALKKGTLSLSIDLKPALSGEQLDARILRDFEEAKNKQFKNALNHLYPLKMIPVIIARSGISPEKRVNEITREERQSLVRATKDFRLTLTGLRGYNEAIITQGGVSVKEIDPSTMESKKVPDLYFAGEVLDLDAVTGGFNLQIAWATGYAAGMSAGE